MNDAAEKLEESQEEVKGLGETLREKRQSLGLDVADIAGKLHLKPALLEDIEAEQYDPALSVTFTKGYIRLYAKHLGLPPEDVLALFDNHTNLEKQPTKLRSFSQKVAKQASDARLMMVTYVIIAVVIGLVIVWWVQQSSESASPTQDYIKDSSTNNTVAEPIQVQQNEITSVNETGQAVAAGSPALSTPSLTEPEAINAASAETAETPPPTSDPLNEASRDVADAFAQVESLHEETSQGSDTLPSSDPLSNRDSELSQHNSAASEEQNIETTAQQSSAQNTDLQSTNLQNDVLQEDALQNDDLQNNGQQSDFTSPAAIADTAEASAQVTDDFASVEPQMTELVFHFSGDCWMNLTDATGEVVAYGVKESGYVMPVSGVPPFEVVLGAPQVVAITVDGEPHDMSVYPAGRTARFIIGGED
ncbi:MAG: RodZ domain-containing protein [Aestuariibacter sp.]